MRILDSKNPDMRSVIAGAPLLSEYLDDESRVHFEMVKDLLAGVGIDFVLNPRLVRGLDYYSRTVFEWVTDRLGAQSAICSGGRYDGLIAELGGRQTPAVGWALGMERVVELMQADAGPQAAAAPDVYLVVMGETARRRGFAVAETLRRGIPGLQVFTGQTAAGFKAQMRHADKSGARFALIIGEQEVADGRVSLKDLRSDAEQQSLTESEAAVTLGAALEPVE
jgi:histidyl-tRNA synthetase